MERALDGKSIPDILKTYELASAMPLFDSSVRNA